MLDENPSTPPADPVSDEHGHLIVPGCPMPTPSYGAGEKHEQRAIFDAPTRPEAIPLPIPGQLSINDDAGPDDGSDPDPLPVCPWCSTRPATVEWREDDGSDGPGQLMRSCAVCDAREAPPEDNEPDGLTIAHTLAGGTLVHGTERGDRSRDVLKRNGYRWAGNVGAWFMPRTRDHAANVERIERVAEGLRAAGFAVAVNIDNEQRDDDDPEHPLTYRERRERKAERLREWADSRDTKAKSAGATADRIMGAIPSGQPILVGHHSERRHRRDIGRLDRAMSQAVEHGGKAATFRGRADNIEHAADVAIYDDDPDAIERLTDKLRRLEDKREQMKVRNAEYRREHRDELRAMTSAYQRSHAMPHPSYELQNIGGNISRTRARLARLTKQDA